MGRLTFCALAALALVLGGVASGQNSASGPGPLAKLEGGELVAEVADRAAWCQPDITFTIRAQDDKYFNFTELDAQGRPGQITLQRLLGILRVGLERNCTQANSVTFNGFVDDVFVYNGYAEKRGSNGEWILVELPVGLTQPPEASPAQTALAAPPATASPPPNPASVGECDRLAAHPDDPQRPKSIKGVEDDDLKAGPALAACEEAVAVEPSNSRLKYQLARALLGYDKPAEGLEMLTDAAELGSGAATAALGDITLYGLLDDNPDPATAKKLYEQAAGLGFKPARALAAAIEENPKEETGAQQAAEPQYHQPERVAQMLEGRALPGSGGDFMETIAYSTRFVAGIVHHCPNRGVNITPQQIMNTVFRRAGPAAGFFGLAAAGEGGYAGVQQQGMDDGYAMAFTAGCESAKILAAEQTLTKTMQ